MGGLFEALFKFRPLLLREGELTFATPWPMALLLLAAIVVAAAGNEAHDVMNSTPANCANVVAVGAVGPNGTIASYSNYGDLIDIMAPGGEATGDAGDRVYSTSWDGSTGNPIFVAAMGTSMAAPHVTGVLALLRGMQPGTVHIYALSCLATDCSEISSGSSRRTTLMPGQTAGNYSFTDLLDGIYYVFAYKDVDGNGAWDAGVDPWGSSEVLFARGSVFDDVDILIYELTAAAVDQHGDPRTPPFDPAALNFD